MLAPSQPVSQPSRPRPLWQTISAAVVVIGVAVLGALLLYFVTDGLFLLAHQTP
jgi:hypothetical protein